MSIKHEQYCFLRFMFPLRSISEGKPAERSRAELFTPFLAAIYDVRSFRMRDSSWFNPNVDANQIVDDAVLFPTEKSRPSSWQNREIIDQTYFFLLLNYQHIYRWFSRIYRRIQFLFICSFISCSLSVLRCYIDSVPVTRYRYVRHLSIAIIELIELIGKCNDRMSGPWWVGVSLKASSLIITAQVSVITLWVRPAINLLNFWSMIIANSKEKKERLGKKKSVASTSSAVWLAMEKFRRFTLFFPLFLLIFDTMKSIMNSWRVVQPLIPPLVLNRLMSNRIVRSRRRIWTQISNSHHISCWCWIFQMNNKLLIVWK